MVRDLLIQSRGYEPNYLAVEMKKKGKMKNAKNDRECLISLVQPSSLSNRTDCVHDTLLGAFIVVGENGIDMEIYRYLWKDGKVEMAGYLGVCMQGQLYITLVNKTVIR